MYASSSSLLIEISKALSIMLISSFGFFGFFQFSHSQSRLFSLLVFSFESIFVSVLSSVNSRSGNKFSLNVKSHKNSQMQLGSFFYRFPLQKSFFCILWQALYSHYRIVMQSHQHSCCTRMSIASIINALSVESFA